MISAAEARKITWAHKYQKVINELDMRISQAAGEGKDHIEYAVSNLSENDFQEVVTFLKNDKGFYVERTKGELVYVGWPR